MDELARQMLEKIPKPVSLLDVMEKYPVMYEESMNTVLVQEVHTYRHTRTWEEEVPYIDILVVNFLMALICKNWPCLIINRIIILRACEVFITYPGYITCVFLLSHKVIRYNRLLNEIHSTLRDMLKALKGLVVMSEALETMYNSIYYNSVPTLWEAKVSYMDIRLSS